MPDYQDDGVYHSPRDLMTCSCWPVRITSMAEDDQSNPKRILRKAQSTVADPEHSAESKKRVKRVVRSSPVDSVRPVGDAKGLDHAEPEFTCFECGTKIPSSSDRCPKCNT